MSHRRRIRSRLVIRLVVFGLLACATELAARPVRAQPAAAEALFRAGRDAAERGDHASACAKLRESYRIEAAVGTLVNIAMCEEALGELSRAWAHFHDALHALPAEDRRRDVVASRLTKLDAQLPRLMIGLSPTAPRDTRVTVGAIELTSASFDVPLPYDPGHYAIDVTAPGRAKRSYAVVLEEGQRVALQVEPGPEEPRVGPPESARGTRSRAPVQASAPTAASTAAQPLDTSAAAAAQRAVAWALIGAASVSFVAAAIAGGFVIDRASTVAERCPNDRCDRKGELAAESGRAAYAVLLAAGITALATSSAGVYLLLDAEPSRAVAGAGFSARF